MEQGAKRPQAELPEQGRQRRQTKALKALQGRASLRAAKGATRPKEGAAPKKILSLLHRTEMLIEIR